MERAKAAFGNAASRVQGNIASLGRTIGPPWTKDHKTATLRSRCHAVMPVNGRLGDLHVDRWTMQPETP